MSNAVTSHAPVIRGPLRYPGGKNGMFYANCADDGCDYTSGTGTESKVRKDAQQHADAKNKRDPSRQIDPAASGPHGENLRCPLPKCNGELYLELHANVPITGGSIPEDLRWQTAISNTWEVVCTEGHTILLPVSAHDEVASFTDECSGCDESARLYEDDEIRHNDTERLREVLGLGEQA